MDFRPHGANPKKLYELLGVPAPEKIIDFSTNANAVPQRCGFSPDVARLLEEYPDDEASALKAAVSRVTGAGEKNILVTNGANEAVYILASFAASRENCVLEPAYGEYSRALSGFGAVPKAVFSLEARDIPKGGAVWICNPCNPTGNFIPDAVLNDLFAQRPDALFIVDEAYRDFIWTEEELLPFEPAPNVVRIRSLTKTYNLCGARVGYLLSNEDAVKQISRRKPCWSVNSLAQEAALYFMSDETLLTRTRRYYAREVPRLSRALRGLGYGVMPTRVNFFLTEVDDDERFIRYMLTRGIAVRHTRNFEKLRGRYVRIAAQSVRCDDALIAAARDFR